MIRSISHIVFILCLVLSVQTSTLAAESPSVETLLNYLQIDQSQEGDLLQGKILSPKINEASDIELAVRLVMYVKAPVAKVAELIRSNKLISQDPSVLSFKEIDANAGLPDFKELAFTELQKDDAKHLLEAEPGSRFNLSADEIETLRSLKKSSKDAGKDAIPSIASEQYQKFLLKRYQAYRNGGLSAVAPYQRGDSKTSSPGQELQDATSQASILSQYFSSYSKAFANFPKANPADMINRFFIVNQRVENRPTFILVHRMAFYSPVGALMMERQYYVGHSYNSLQILSGCMPYKDGSLIFYANRTFTDQVAGFASGMRHNIGRDQMRDSVMKDFEKARGLLQ
jgi:hypothetical protein